MKNSIFTAALLLAGVSNVLAASSVDLSVTGAITPAACTPALSGGGVVDHGKISFSDLNPVPSRDTALPVASLALSVNCTAATLFAIKSSDNRGGTSAEPGAGLSSFGLGLVNGDKKVGWYTLKTSSSLADGVSQPVIESADGKVWFNAPEVPRSGSPIGCAPSTLAPAPIRTAAGTGHDIGSVDTDHDLA